MPEETEKTGIKPVVIMGPTASGKTELALTIASACGGEIISADSRQVYKYLSAGTAKPPGEWKTEGSRSFYLVNGIPYHLVDFLDPKASYDAGKFVSDAEALVKDISARGKRAVFAGGTGLYIQAYWNGLDPLPGSDQALRNRLMQIASTAGKEGLHARLREIDPKAAVQIPPGNIQRVIRALEVHEITGTPISSLWSRRFHGALPTHQAVFAVLDWNKALLHDRIRERTQSVFGEWMKETKALLDKGFPEDCPALKSLGYPQAMDCALGRISQQEAVHQIITLTNAYAKRQTTWFRQYKNALRIRIEAPEDWDPAAIARKITA